MVEEAWTGFFVGCIVWIFQLVLIFMQSWNQPWTATVRHLAASKRAQFILRGTLTAITWQRQMIKEYLKLIPSLAVAGWRWQRQRWNRRIAGISLTNCCAPYTLKCFRNFGTACLRVRFCWMLKIFKMSFEIRNGEFCCILFLFFFFQRIHLALNFRENDVVIRAWQYLLTNAWCAGNDPDLEDFVPELGGSVGSELAEVLQVTTMLLDHMV